MSSTRVLIAALALSLAGACLAQTASPASPAGQTVPVQDESYRVRAEDVINVTVADVAEASGDFLVRKDGYITVPLVGEIQVAGKTTKEITAVITERLKKEIRKPSVTVNLKSTTLERIYVMGAVRGGGVLDYKPKWRLTEVIAAGGGLASAPERTKVLIFRAGADHQEIALKRLLVDGDDKANVEVQPGDVLNFQTDVTIRVQVVGRVDKQGPIEVREGQGAAEALAAAGGAAADAKLTGAKIVRGGKEIPVDLYAAVTKGDQTKNVTLQDGDTLIVPALLTRVAVIGQVGHPGPIVVPDGETLTLTRAVALAGGPGRGAKTDKVQIVRMGADRKPVATDYNLKGLIRADKGLVDPLLQDGDLVMIAQSGKAGASEFSSGLGLFNFFRFFVP